MTKGKSFMRIGLLSLMPFGILYLTYQNFYRPAMVQMEGKDSGKPPRNITNTDERCKNSIQSSSSKWFQSRLNKSVPTFWTADNIQLEKGAKRWWMNLQRTADVDLRPTFEELVKQGVPKHAIEIDDRGDGCISCAVVGNSGNLKESRYGELIDSHDAVIRFNHAPTVRFERDVGSKTTFHIMYPESAKSLSPEVSLTLAPFKPLDVQWLLSAITVGNITKTYQRVMTKVRCDTSKIAVINPEFMRYVHTNWLEKHGRYSSTGMIGIAFALQECDTVSIFGFGASKDGAWQHYWEVLPVAMASAFRQTGVHDGNFESNLIKKLETEKIAAVHWGIM